MIRLNVYKKQNIDMNLLIGSYEKEVWNMPFYNTNITLWKGVDNTIEFSVRNHDRKSEKLKDNQFLKFVAINNELQQVICKKMDVVNEALGRYSVTITKDELNNFDEGHFVGHVSVVDKVNNCEDCKNCFQCPHEFSCPEDLLYSGLDWNPNFDVEIKPNKLDLMTECTILKESDFVMDTYQDYCNGKTYQQFTSTIIKSDITPSHTFVVKLKDFDGILKIQGSNQECPQSEIDDWFTIEEKSYEIKKDEFDSDDDFDYCYCEGNDCECGDYYLTNFEPVTGSETFSAELNCLWVRVQYIREMDKPAKIEEVQYRN